VRLLFTILFHDDTKGTKVTRLLDCIWFCSGSILITYVATEAQRHRAALKSEVRFVGAAKRRLHNGSIQNAKPFVHRSLCVFESSRRQAGLLRRPATKRTPSVISVSLWPVRIPEDIKGMQNPVRVVGAPVRRDVHRVTFVTS
jgi:hypothetical protein